jgi:integrase
LRQAVNWGLTNYNPCDKVEPPRSKRRQQKNTIRAMSQEQAKGLPRSRRRRPLGNPLASVVGHGNATQEAYALQWSEVDFAHNTIRIVHSLYRCRGASGGWDLQPPKTERSRRSVTVPASIIKRLKEHRVHQLEERAVMRKAFVRKRYKVSTIVIIRRLAERGIRSTSQFQQLYRAQLAVYQGRADKQSGGGSVHQTRMKKVGRRFAKAVIESTGRDGMTYPEAYALLGVTNDRGFDELRKPREPTTDLPLIEPTIGEYGGRVAS